MIWEVLPVGAENAVSMGDLAKTFDTDTRRVRSVIRRERSEGHLICSSADGGYYLPKDRTEILQFVRFMKVRAIGTLELLKSFERVLDIVEGQEALEEWQNADSIG